VPQKKILVISNSARRSGAEVSMIQTLSLLDPQQFKIVVVLPHMVNYQSLFPGHWIVHKLPLIFFKRSINPIYLWRCCINIIFVSFKLNSLVHLYDIDIVYSNTIKASLYSAFTRSSARIKKIWHIRDSIKSRVVTSFLISRNDRLICNSHYILQQVNATNKEIYLIHGSIDVNEWQPPSIKDKSIKKRLGLNNEIKLVAQISQITSWKNQTDFIRVAKIIRDKYPHVHFLIIGEIISSADATYKNELKREIEKLGLQHYISFLGFQKNIREVMPQIDILLHPAINEPFGRVVIEAMAMQKPVVAYRCGGLVEIIEQGKTGYLIEPHNVLGLAEKTLDLLKDEALGNMLGVAGRLRVNDMFNIRKMKPKIIKSFE
jgi:glycosyltransferase involved in cell wall biosynthesis